MIERLLGRLLDFSLNSPRTVASGAALASLLSIAAFTVPFDLSFAGIMDRSHPEVSRYFDASSRYGLGGFLPLLIEGPEQHLDEALLEVQLALDDLDEVRGVRLPPSREWLIARAPWWVDRELFDAWVALVSPDVAPEESNAFVAELEAVAARDAPVFHAGVRLITIVMAHDPFELALDASDFPRIREVVSDVLGPFGMSGHFAGMPAIITQEQESTLERMRILGPLSLVLVLAILVSIERRVRILASVAVPMLLSVGCTLAAIGLISGRLTLMESVFGVMVFGLGVDFAIHLLLRLREELATGVGFDASLRRAMTGTGRGVVTGAATTAGAFLILCLAPDPVFSRLGLAGGIGLLLCLLFLLVSLPASWRWVEARRPDPGRRSRAPGPNRLARIAGSCSRRPLRVAIVGSLVMGSAALQWPSIRYETNLARVFSRDIDAVHTSERIHDLFGIDPGPWLVPAKDLDSARSLTAAFLDEPIFGRVESLAQLIRADVQERRQILDAIAPALARILRARPASAQAADPAGARDRLDPLALLLTAQTLGPPRPDLLPEALADRWVGPDGTLLVYAFASQPALDSAVAAGERRVAQSIDPRATSINVIYEALIGTDRPWLPPILLGVLVFVVVVIQLDLRSARFTLLALIPVSASMIGSIGLLTALGFSFNTVTLVGVPILLGLSVDDGIHVVHRMREQPDAPIGDAIGAVAQGIALTTATTCASVALLLWSRHPGIESVALLLLVGLPTALLATVTLLPAAAAIASKARSPGGGPGARL